jgi:hypothetical protein
MYRISTKDLEQSNGMNEQLYRQTLSYAAAGPAVCNALIEGITSMFNIACLAISNSLSVTAGKLEWMKSM